LKKNRENNDNEEILSRLSERVEKAISTIQELRRERDQLRARVDEVESQLRETEDLRRERGEIRDRIESILSNLEALDAD